MTNQTTIEPIATLGALTQILKQALWVYAPYPGESDIVALYGRSEWTAKRITFHLSPYVLPYALRYFAARETNDQTQTGLDAQKRRIHLGAPQFPTFLDKYEHTSKVNRQFASVGNALNLSRFTEGGKHWASTEKQYTYMIAHPDEFTRLGHRLAAIAFKWDGEFAYEIDAAILAYSIARQLKKRARKGKALQPLKPYAS